MLNSDEIKQNIEDYMPTFLTFKTFLRNLVSWFPIFFGLCILYELKITESWLTDMTIIPAPECKDGIKAVWFLVLVFQLILQQKRIHSAFPAYSWLVTSPYFRALTLSNLENWRVLSPCSLGLEGGGGWTEKRGIQREIGRRNGVQDNWGKRKM